MVGLIGMVIIVLVIIAGFNISGFIRIGFGVFQSTILGLLMATPIFLSFSLTIVYMILELAVSGLIKLAYALAGTSAEEVVGKYDSYLNED